MVFMYVCCAGDIMACKRAVHYKYCVNIFLSSVCHFVLCLERLLGIGKSLD